MASALLRHPQDADTARQPTDAAEAVRWIAQLGGFLGRTGDGEPGAQVRWRGLQRLPDLTLMYLLFSPPAHMQKCG